MVSPLLTASTIDHPVVPPPVTVASRGGTFNKGYCTFTASFCYNVATHFINSAVASPAVLTASTGGMLREKTFIVSSVDSTKLYDM